MSGVLRKVLHCIRLHGLVLFIQHPRLFCKESYFRGVYISCTAVYCLWAVMPKPDMGSISHIKNQWNILIIGKNYVNYQNYQNLMLLTSLDTKRTLMHLFLFTNSAQRELVSICMQLQLNFLAFIHLIWIIIYLS